MTPNRPYLVRALLDWIIDNDCTPYLILGADVPGVEVPAEYVEDDKIVLNISPTAVRNLDIGNDEVSFDGRFAGRPHRISAPIGAVLAVYAKETGQGMAFEADSDERPTPPDDDTPGAHLKVVK
jgi:stringent starvation protein B